MQSNSDSFELEVVAWQTFQSKILWKLLRLEHTSPQPTYNIDSKGRWGFNKIDPPPSMPLQAINWYKCNLLKPHKMLSGTVLL